MCWKKYKRLERKKFLTVKRQAWPSGWDAGLSIRRSRVRFLLPATAWICLRWPRI